MDQRAEESHALPAANVRAPAARIPSQEMRCDREHPERCLAGLLVGGAFLLLGARLAELARRFAADLVYWDQLDFLDPFFREASLLEAFLWQHGPHRQGLAALVYALLLPLTSWSGRAEAFVAVGLLAAGCLLLWRVVHRLTGGTKLKDLFLPLACLSLAAHDLLVGPQNLANGPLPFLLVALTAWTLLVRSRRWRCGWLSLLGAAAVYTGFAFFLVPAVLLLLALEGRAARGAAERWTALAGVTGVLLSVASFFIGYRWLPAAPCFTGPPPLRDYLGFLAGLSGRAWGISSPGVALASRPLAVASHGLRVATSLGLLAAVAAAGLLGLSWMRRPGEEGAGRRRAGGTLVVLCSFSLFHALFTAFGRTCLGPAAALASRYTIYSVPGLCGLYLAARVLAAGAGRSRKRAAAATLLLLSLLLARERLSLREWTNGGWVGQKKQEWSECFRQHREIERCDREVQFAVFPSEARETSRIEEKLAYIEAHALSLFRTTPGAEVRPPVTVAGAPPLTVGGADRRRPRRRAGRAPGPARR